MLIRDPEIYYPPPVIEVLYPIQEYWEEQKRKPTTLVANDFQINTNDKREELLNIITKTYHDDKFDEPINGHNPLFETIEAAVWIRPISKNTKFINPRFLGMLEKELKYNKFSIIQHLLDQSYPDPEVVKEAMVKNYLKAGFPRGYTAFYENFDEIMEFLIISRYRKRMERAKAAGKTLDKKNLDYIVEVLEKYPNRIFCDALPIPSKHLFVVEKKGKSSKTELSLMENAMEAVSTVTSLNHRINPVTVREASRLDYKINKDFITTFHDVYFVNYLKSKKGVFRKNNYGTPTSFNSRCVIVSQQGPQKYDHLKISYPVAFKLFEIHVAKILIDEYGYTPIDVFEMRANYSRQFNPKVYEIMMRLIDNFWYGEGWACNFLRHPYLSTLSSQHLRISDIGTNPLEFVISVSVLILAGFNADFDGDEMFLQIWLDKLMTDLTEPLAPHHSAISTDKPYAYNEELNFPKPPISFGYNWLYNRPRGYS